MVSSYIGKQDMHCNIIYQYLSIYLRRSTASSSVIHLWIWNINSQYVIVDNDISEEPCYASSIVTLDLKGKSCLWKPYKTIDRNVVSLTFQNSPKIFSPSATIQRPWGILQEDPVNLTLRTLVHLLWIKT